jgi:predicted TPR repeat methyltransferase
MTNAAPFSTRTSGDLTADRRYAYGDGALADGDFEAARDLFAQTLELVPHWPPAHFALAKACLGLGDRDAAAEALRRVQTLDSDDRLGAGVLLAQISGAPPVMPDAYVAALFDEYAPRFDSHLVEALNYRAPTMLGDLLHGVMGEGMHFPAALDLGCGTGLMARALSGRFGGMAGVDLSAGMLAIAEKGGLYSRLETAELLAFLTREAASSADLVLAADVFCYVPDLLPIFIEAHRVLKSGGLFAFSIQTQEGEGVAIGADSRVHHAPAQIRAWARAAGLAITREMAASTREDRGVPVAGALFVLAKG